MKKKRTVVDIINMKKAGEKIAMLTCYDAGFARMLDQMGLDILLVGDSLGNVVLGYDSTVPVTMDEMIHHTRAVCRGSQETLVVGDMPFLSYQVSIPEAIANAGRFLKECGCEAVKLEGGRRMAKTVQAIVEAGIPVMGHIGLTPQTAGQLGGYKVQGKDLDSARLVIEDARALEDAGAFSIVLECVPDKVAQAITEAINIPTIGIGAGNHCDGQVLVMHDMLGLFEKFIPRFVKTYAHLAPQIKDAVKEYVSEVRSGKFPASEHTFTMSADIDDLKSESKTKKI